MLHPFLSYVDLWHSPWCTHYLAMMHTISELCYTCNHYWIRLQSLQSYAAIIYEPVITEPCCTLYWAMMHPLLSYDEPTTELCCTPLLSCTAHIELCCNHPILCSILCGWLLGYAATIAACSLLYSFRFIAHLFFAICLVSFMLHSSIAMTHHGVFCCKMLHPYIEVQCTVNLSQFQI